MKKLLRAVASLALSAIILAGCSQNIVDGDGEGSSRSLIVTYSNAAEICEIVYEGYNKGVKGPISITKGTLRSGFSSKTVYLVALSGTETDDVEDQSTGYLTDLLSGFNLNNAYLANTVDIICACIPMNSNIILAGHSLGGMVCQQVAANSTIKEYYNVLNTVCFGSPLLSAGSREGTTKRLGDTSDVVPYMSGSLFNNTIWAIAGLNRENGGYGTDAFHAHTESYLRPDVWGKYDVTGTKNGGAKLTLNKSSQLFFHSPTSIYY